jgi:Cu-Zn family superoxide dismutase
MGNNRWQLPVAALLAVFSAVGCSPEAAEPGPDAAAGVERDNGIPVDTNPDDTATAGATQGMARANLTGAPGSGISGTVEVTERTGGVAVMAHVTGLKQGGPLGFHLHEVGACTPPDFESAGEHFNPGSAQHACSPTSPRHAGDLGNLGIADGGEGHLELETDLLTVADGPASVVGRAVVLHAAKDDCTTQPSGDSGDRIACGVFERVTN